MEDSAVYNVIQWLCIGNRDNCFILQRCVQIDEKILMMGEWLISDFEKQIYFQRKDKTEHVISRLGWGAKNPILSHWSLEIRMLTNKGPGLNDNDVINSDIVLHSGKYSSDSLRKRRTTNSQFLSVQCHVLCLQKISRRIL